MSKLRLGVLFGGASSEYEISLRSSASVLRGLDKEKYDITVVGITKDGDWFYLPEVTPDEIENGTWLSLPKFDCTLSLSRKLRGLYIFETGKTLPLDVIFPVMHGENAEDGRLQGACELAGIPCVGPGCASSAVCMDKSITKLLAATTGVSQADWLTVTNVAFKNRDAVIAAVEEKFSYPVFVKPAGTGSSVGAAKANDQSELVSTLSDALSYGGKALVEEFIPAREIETAALGNDDALISVCGEVLSATETYSYESKYSNSASKTVAPADLAPEVSEKIRSYAKAIFHACSCRGLSRIDFFIHKKTGEIIFNEINTIPGFTSISMYAKLFDASGIPFGELLDRIIACAVED